MQLAERTHELEERNEILQELSFLDGLTCIPNRRRFDDFFNMAFSLSIRMAILMLDIDEFKKYNDTYGVVTVSIGIVYEVPYENQNPSEFIAKADEALYYSKKNGRNRVEFAKNQWKYI